MGGMLFDNPPQFSLKISFMVRKNPDGPPDVVKTTYPEALPRSLPLALPLALPRSLPRKKGVRNFEALRIRYICELQT